jgi:hypothetical protein
MTADGIAYLRTGLTLRVASAIGAADQARRDAGRAL